jgi:hypothetical protein
MTNRVTMRDMEEGEEHEVCALIARVFEKYGARDFSPEGIRSSIDMQSRTRWQSEACPRKWLDRTAHQVKAESGTPRDARRINCPESN